MMLFRWPTFNRCCAGLSAASLILWSLLICTCTCKEEMLQLAPGYNLRWEVKDEQVFLHVEARTLGWVGFGISYNGEMEHSDIVIGGIDKDTNRVYFEDRHGVGNSEPVVDQSQDYKLRFVGENETHTILEFSRKLETCDPDDIPITWDSHKLIWAMGDTDVVRYHDVRRGTYAHNLLDPVQVKPDLSEYQVWTMMSSLPLPNVETSYWCTLHKTPDEITKMHHMIGFNARLVSAAAPKHTHHIDIYKCNFPEDKKASFDNYLQERGHQGVDCYFPEEVGFPVKYCQDVQYGWTIGSKETIVPNNTGFPFTGSMYYMMEVHYDNPQVLQNVPMRTGLEVYYTPELRPIESGFMLLGSKIKYTQMIPPNSIDFLNVGHCGFSCTQYFPAGGIKVYNVLLHAHLSGRTIKVRHWRNGTELPWLIYDEHFDFNYQQNRELREMITVLPGDHLAVECLYESTWKNGTATLGGRSTREEMCEASFFYYPRMDLITECRSELPKRLTLPFLGIEEIEEDEDGAIEDPLVIAPAKYKGKRYSQVIESLNWDQEFRDRYQELHRFSMHEGECFPLTQHYNANLTYPKSVTFVPVQTCTRNGTGTSGTSTDLDYSSGGALKNLGTSWPILAIVTASVVLFGYSFPGPK